MNLKDDSRKVKKGDTFIAIRGITEDGHKYIESAIKNGASKIICEHGSYSVETIIVPDTRKYLENEMKKYFDEVLKDIKLIGITGTNGKTTTTFFIYELLNLLGHKSAVLGTIGFYVDDIMLPTSNTTPGLIELYELFDEARKRKCEYIAIEVSSHSLYHDRNKGLLFDVAGFTNLTQDHLDFHKTMEEYKNAKLKILNYLKDNGVIVINTDDKYSEDFKKKNYLSYGYNGEDLKILSIETYDEHSKVNFNFNNKTYEILLNITSDFNVYNYLMALLVVNLLGYEIENIIKVSEKLYLPAGRSEEIIVNDAKVVIDYAHSPDSVEKMIDNYRPQCKGKLITLTGCDGDRDKLKRPIMASIACKKSEYAILTHTHPFGEDPESVKKDVIKGIKENGIFIDDRKEAIKKGLEILKPGDIFLILGMGRETYQTYGKELRPHSDYDEVIKFKES